MLTLGFWDFFLIALIVRGPELLSFITAVTQFWSRIDRAQCALACDDHANDHYKTTPCSWFRAKLATKAFLLNR